MKKILNFLGNIDTFITCTSLAIIITITLCGVVMRYIIGKPIAWLEEVQILLFVWCIFFGASVAFREGGHVGIDIVAARLGKHGRMVLDIIVYFITLGVLVYMLLGSYELTAQVTRKVTPYLKLPYSYVDMAAPIGCVFMILQYTAAMLKKYVWPDEKDEKEVME